MFLCLKLFKYWFCQLPKFSFTLQKFVLTRPWWYIFVNNCSIGLAENCWLDFIFFFHFFFFFQLILYKICHWQKPFFGCAFSTISRIVFDLKWNVLKVDYNVLETIYSYMRRNSKTMENSKQYLWIWISFTPALSKTIAGNFDFFHQYVLLVIEHETINSKKLFFRFWKCLLNDKSALIFSKSQIITRLYILNWLLPSSGVHWKRFRKSENLLNFQERKIWGWRERVSKTRAWHAGYPNERVSEATSHTQW